MPGVTACLLGDLSARRELGKVGTQSDIHLHDFREGDRHVTLIVPARYPDLKGLSYAVQASQAAVLVVQRLDAQVGEQILATDAAGIQHGIIVLKNHLQPEELKPLLRGTTLEHWPVQTEADWPTVRAHLAAAPVPRRDGPVLVPVDHHFDVKGVGAVVLGVVKQGVLHKGDTLHAWPDKIICPVRSIQCHDVDVAQAVTGDRVGLALRNTKAEQLDRGMVLAPADAPLVARRAGDRISLRLRRSPFSKQSLPAGAVVHLGLGMQFVPLRLTSDAPGAGQDGAVSAELQKGLVSVRGETGIVWHVDAAPQRVVGGAAVE